MSYKSWDTPATTWGNTPKRSYGKSSKPIIVNADWRSLPWAALYSRCAEEQETALAMAMSDRQSAYDSFIRKKLEQYMTLNPESGSYEGNLSDEYPMGDIPRPEKFRLKRLASASAVEQFALEYGLKDTGVTILGQIIKRISSFKLTTTSGNVYDPAAAKYSLDNDDSVNLISGARLYSAYFSDKEAMGLYEFLMADNRSNWLTTQYKAPAKSFCALVPLIMYAFKLSRNIPYTHWNRNEVVGIVNPKLVSAMMFTTEETFSKLDILKARNEGLTIKTGDKAGQLRSPVYTFKLYGSNSLSHLPDYVQVMYAQIWCAHPENRTRYMILDHNNWDGIPQPLVSTEVLKDTEVTHSFDTVADVDTSNMPWL